jgi:exopolyphosphatase/guanosine-5'-triphosphate,3'-diphosphate pyrophosphatase
VSGRLAVVDVGSNSVRLFLCEEIARDGPRGERITTVTGLGRGAAADGAIAPDALERLDACLAGYAERVEAFAPERVVAVGTSAVRDAANRSEVDALVRGRLGVGLRALSGDEEAAIAFAGARLAVGGDGPCLVVDVGGGSTELVRGGPGGPDASASLQLGAVRQTERHLRSDPPAAGELAALRAEALHLVSEALGRIGLASPAVGVAGTITTLAAIEQGGYDPERVHRHRLARAGVERTLARLAAMTTAERRGVPGLEPARAGVIVAGAAIVAVVLEAAGLDEMTVSEQDLLDGVALATAEGRLPGS